MFEAGKLIWREFESGRLRFLASESFKIKAVEIVDL